jgi:crotonobetainyl-CoA:carnitine CoA-transferase CaiB-like acyl-CoA transferase
MGYLSSGTVPQPQGTAFPSIAPYEVFETADGGVMITCANDRLFRSLCEVVGAPEVADDVRFATNPDRVEHRQELAGLLNERLRGKPRARWLELLGAARVPAAPVATMADIAADEQTGALEILEETEGRTFLQGPISVDRERVRHASPPPPLGAHSAEVLGEVGYSAAEIEELAASGVVRLA